MLRNRAPEPIARFGRASQARLGRTVTPMLLLASLAPAQSLGTVTLPADIADAGTKITAVLQKDPVSNRAIGYSEGPAVDSLGNLFFTEDYNGSGNIWKVTPDGKASNFYNGPALPNGMEFDPNWKLITCEKGGLGSFDKNGVRTPVPVNPALEADYRINDVTIASNGWMFFTNHQFGNTFFFRDATGKVTRYPDTPPLGVSIPNGIEYIEEKKWLLVNSSGENKVYQYDVSDNGTVSNKRDFAPINVPDGITLDSKGNVYVASYGEGAIHVLDPSGKDLGKIAIGNGQTSGNTSNCVFGGPNHDVLYMTGNGGAYKVQLKIPGRRRPGAASALRYRIAPVADRSTQRVLFGSLFDLAGRAVDPQAQAPRVLFSLPR